jgi:hypothetical protein
MFPQKKQTEMHTHTHLWTDRQTDRQTDGGFGEYNKTSGVCVCLLYRYKRVNMCRDVCALFLETSSSSDDGEFAFRCFSHPNEEEYLFLNRAAAAKAQS